MGGYVCMYVCMCVCVCVMRVSVWECVNNSDKLLEKFKFAKEIDIVDVVKTHTQTYS